jgi:hypothetical protein
MGLRHHVPVMHDVSECCLHIAVSGMRAASIWNQPSHKLSIHVSSYYLSPLSHKNKQSTERSGLHWVVLFVSCPCKQRLHHVGAYVGRLSLLGKSIGWKVGVTSP